MIKVFYFVYFQVVAVNMAFMPAHMRSLGLDGRQISMVCTVTPLFSLGLPLVWAWLADRSHRHGRVLHIVTFGAWLGFSPMLFAKTFPVVLAGYIGYGMFVVGIGGLADAFAVARVRAGAVYGRMRIWGSIGFILGANATGIIQTTHRAYGALVPVAMWLALGATFVASLSLRGTREAVRRPRGADVKTLLADPRLRLILAAGALHWICISPYNVTFSILLRDLGLSSVVSGVAFSLGVLAEMVVLLCFHRLQRRFSVESLLIAAFAFSSLRWLGIAMVRSPGALVALQVLHGMTFGMFWSAAIALIAEAVPASLRATGQALLVIAINMGGAVGNICAGRLYDAAGPRVLFILAAIAEAAPILVVLQARRRLRAQSPTTVLLSGVEGEK